MKPKGDRVVDRIPQPPGQRRQDLTSRVVQRLEDTGLLQTLLDRGRELPGLLLLEAFDQGLFTQFLGEFFTPDGNEARIIRRLL